ncbi:MAG TPA: GNAT family N-acetyltransferase [Terriglobales bacterium]
MADVLDLRQYRASQLDPLLTAEAAEWDRRLDWDYTASATLIRQYIEARILPGYVLAERGRLRIRPYGYGFFIYEGVKGMIGNLYVEPAHRLPDYAAERLLLAHMVETLRASPGLDRIESQLMPYTPEALGSSFAEEGFEAFRRVFLNLDLKNHSRATTPPAALAGLRIEPWGSASHEEAARVILHAYQDHVDSRINDQYRTFAGALRFMHNVAHYPGCGMFDPNASFLARSTAHGGLEGMVLASRVKPGVMHITQICVMPEFRRRGLGRVLIERAMEQARRMGLRSATLTVTRENAGALGLYQRLGFTERTQFDAYVWRRRVA